MDFSRLLAMHDHPTIWEYPPGFDYEAASAKFATFVAALTEGLGRPLKVETGSLIQDASFHSQAFLPLPSDEPVLIRFSNFGDMATVSDEELVPEVALKLVTELLKRHGYAYVPAAILNAPYSGTNPGVTGISTWWIRYFDWV
jgi:hypothetical protein